ncbi:MULTISPECIES: hypothetical protein [Rhizobium]|uniref:hypothetical protein n=1 Tax=Rhizobium TaxID=379 RepID=UPI000A6EB833|nr:MULTISPECIES: hypothetical protein [Rhizobium]MCS0463272.1 hypothetical protein [Rhizobium favelukesii]UFS83644.1 hypothetical protein LPB79_15695 [Rhizobium sp. T136]
MKDNQGARYRICEDAFGIFSVIDDAIGLPAEVGVTFVLLQKPEAHDFLTWLRRGYHPPRLQSSSTRRSQRMSNEAIGFKRYPVKVYPVPAALQLARTVLHQDLAAE